MQSQHEELKKQHADLEEDHRKQGEEFSRTFSDHKERYLQLQQEKEQEISKLKGKFTCVWLPPLNWVFGFVWCERDIFSVLTHRSFVHLLPPEKFHFIDDFLRPLSEICSYLLCVSVWVTETAKKPST